MNKLNYGTYTKYIEKSVSQITTKSITGKKVR